MRLKKYPYTEILGWSASRFERFSSCKRQYYFDYYAKRYDREVDQKLLLRLKNLTSTALEVGNLVHDIIKALLERLIRSNAPLDGERLLNYSMNLCDQYCDSKEFFEVYYQQISQIDKAGIKEKVKEYVLVLLNSERFKWLLENALPFSQEWLVEPEGFGETRIEGLKAYCKVDFLFRVGDKIYIIDWKTGKEDLQKQSRQLKGYTAFACDHFGARAEDVICILFFFKDNREMEFSFSSEEILEFTNSIRNETTEMLSYTSQPQRNIPKSKDEFFMTENSSVCKFCNYKAICFPGELSA